MSEIPGEEKAEEEPKPTYRLYSPNHVALATFLGSPLAGAVLLALNYRRLGNPSAAWRSISVGSMGTIALVAVSFFVPERIGRAAIPAVCAAVLLGIANRLQGAAYNEHIAKGGEKASGWRAAGIALLCGVVIIGGLLAYEFAGPDELGEKVVFGADEEVYYRNGATAAEAMRVGDLLVEIGFFDGTGAKSVVLEKTDDGHAVSFVLQESAFISMAVDLAFRSVGQKLSADVFGGQPVEIRLCDENLKTKHVIRCVAAAPDSE